LHALLKKLVHFFFCSRQWQPLICQELVGQRYLILGSDRIKLGDLKVLPVGVDRLGRRRSALLLRLQFAFWLQHWLLLGSGKHWSFGPCARDAY
jgi:hypothetical protein